MVIRDGLTEALLQENLALKEKVKSLMNMLKKDRIKIKDLEAKIYENSVDMEIDGSEEDADIVENEINENGLTLDSFGTFSIAGDGVPESMSNTQKYCLQDLLYLNRH